tara:strand:+ start:238 stop:375 length:138 start_codon:yes stop_codon:yes gene_type:complete
MKLYEKITTHEYNPKIKKVVIRTSMVNHKHNIKVLNAKMDLGLIK